METISEQNALAEAHRRAKNTGIPHVVCLSEWAALYAVVMRNARMVYHGKGVPQVMVWHDGFSVPMTGHEDGTYSPILPFQRRRSA